MGTVCRPCAIPGQVEGDVGQEPDHAVHTGFQQEEIDPDPLRGEVWGIEEEDHHATIECLICRLIPVWLDRSFDSSLTLAARTNSSESHAVNVWCPSSMHTLIFQGSCHSGIIRGKDFLQGPVRSSSTPITMSFWDQRQVVSFAWHMNCRQWWQLTVQWLWVNVQKSMLASRLQWWLPTFKILNLADWSGGTCFQ